MGTCVLTGTVEGKVKIPTLIPSIQRIGICSVIIIIFMSDLVDNHFCFLVSERLSS